MKDVYTEKEKYAKKQELASPGRYYGDGGTIHENNELNIEIDFKGNVCAVWFRRQALPFNVTEVDHYRSDDMIQMYANDDTKLTGLEILD